MDGDGEIVERERREGSTSLSICKERGGPASCGDDRVLTEMVGEQSDLLTRRP